MHLCVCLCREGEEGGGRKGVIRGGRGREGEREGGREERREREKRWRNPMQYNLKRL